MDLEGNLKLLDYGLKTVDINSYIYIDNPLLLVYLAPEVREA